MAKRRREAYDIINNSTDELFQNNLFDWYLSQGWHDRLLDIRSSFVVKYLQKKSFEDADHADLLCKYYAQYHNFLEAAQVQMHLAKSEFSIGLESRIGYLSQARANASTKTIGMTEMGRSRQSRQELIREISDLLDIANIQGDIIQRVKSDDRITPERKLGVLKHLDGQILTIDEVRWELRNAVFALANQLRALQWLRRPSELLRPLPSDLSVRRLPQHC